MNLPTIHQLRKAGYKVKISHYRYSNRYSDPVVFTAEQRFPIFLNLITRQAKKDREFAYISGKGGETVLSLKTPVGNEIVSHAKCSLKDSFNRKLGIRICIGRLVAKNLIPAEIV